MGVVLEEDNLVWELFVNGPSCDVPIASAELWEQLWKLHCLCMVLDVMFL